MVLSPEREAEIIEQNMPKIYRAIDNFMARCKPNSVIRLSYDDCVQEVSIAFLQYIRRCKSMEDVERFPWYDAIHAMSEHVLRCQPFSVPISTKNFKKVIHSIPTTVSFEVLLNNNLDVDGMSKHWVNDKNTELDFYDFMASQPENMQRIASMRLYGMTFRNIASQCGVSANAIDKKIKTLKKNYYKYQGNNGEEDRDDE